ncbi:MAG TPA: efflux RND transporter periplasmic adaptor subunit, partial [Anaeromyxobacter sp.]|nr:efflux RND transporter periplasmic adaptor subunit [Anaeromyxobacter sp.]
PENPAPAKPSPRRFGAGTLLAVAVAAGALGLGASTLLHRPAPAGGAPAAEAAAKEQYQCPMHPSVVQDHPGDCPICGMKLVKVAAGPGKGAAAEWKPQYQCPMHPTIVQDHPGDCPICGMKLVKVEGGAAGGGQKAERKVLFYRSPMDPKQTSPAPRKDEMGMDYLPVYSDEVGAAPPVEGLATVDIDPSRQQLIGLTTAPVERGQVAAGWRTVGKVAIDEVRVHRMNVKVSGFVSNAHNNFVGMAIQKGDPIFCLYSPELVAAQEEYLLAVRTRDGLRSGGARGNDGDELVAAARRKLELWDVPESELARIQREGRPSKDVMFFAPASGVITRKDAVDGARLVAGDTPIEIVDLTRVWVLADVYEGELRHVKVGMPASLTLKAYPGRAFHGRVTFVDPLLDPKTRTVSVRLEFPNPGGELKPEMFGEVVLQGNARQALRIPADAVIDSGTKSVVFISLGEGRFQPREVKLGDSDGQFTEVISGVSEGERVVTRANFLIDSESRLRASLAALDAGTPPAAPARAAAGAPAASAKP